MSQIQVFDATGLGAGRNFDYFEDVISRLFFRLELSASRSTDAAARLQSFRGRVSLRQMGELAVSRIMNTPICVRRTRRSIGQLSDRHYIVKFQAKGNSLFSQFGRAAYLRPGDFVLCDNTEPYQLMFAGASEQVGLVIPDHRLLEVVPNPYDAVGQRMGHEIAINGVVGELISSVAGRLGDLSSEAQAQSERTLLDLISVAIRESGDADRYREECQIDRLNSIMQFIDAHLRDNNLSPTVIANAHGITSRYLHMLFRAAGSSVGQFVREQRVERCRMQLDDKNTSTLTELALEWGFSDLAHFSRSFKVRYGVSPQQYRQNNPAEVV